MNETTETDPILFYERRFYIFSNFSAFAVEYLNKLWPTSEHCYQAMKFQDPEIQEAVRTQTSAHAAMKYAQSRKDDYRPDWEQSKRAFMKMICRAKLEQHPYVQKKILESGNAILVESSPIDSFWGWGPDKKGRNELGRIWMELRDEWRTGQMTTLLQLIDALAPEWQNIESAPKDGTCILVGYVRTPKIIEVTSWIGEPHNTWRAATDPTHWMPLPPAPGEPRANTALLTRLRKVVESLSGVLDALESAKGTFKAMDMVQCWDMGPPGYGGAQYAIEQAAATLRAAMEEGV